MVGGRAMAAACGGGVGGVNESHRGDQRARARLLGLLRAFVAMMIWRPFRVV